MAEEMFLRFGRKSYFPLKIHLYHFCSNIYHNKYGHDTRLYVFTVKVMMCKRCR